ncbi:MAG TPA: YiiX/YebB-like N1pC/P60 family cysteine hydrolase [Thermodesulfovibrionales bacterium]|nr:YiiX/YebB-like N1pC/P60 family cysteine hydrolase [Thermodesulfovibrionales bacterium]
MRFLRWILIIFVVTYALLLIPDRHPTSSPVIGVSQKQPFAWNQDAYWDTLEAKFRELINAGCKDMSIVIAADIAKLNVLTEAMSTQALSPDSTVFTELEQQMFKTGSLVAGCKILFPGYMNAMTELRAAVKKQSRDWDMGSNTARTTLYRLLYGSRAAEEEIILQMPPESAPALMMGTDEPSQTPSVTVRGVKLHSGDILVSRGGAPTSALIARGNDFPGNFSHIALLYVEPATHEPKLIESHIERGVVVSSVEEYIKDKKLRILVVRLRADLPQIKKDPMLPHKAAEFAFKNATGHHIPYDFEMDYKEHSKLFCSEVASAAYEKYGMNLWMGISHISSPGLRKWLSAFGVTHFETQEPSDLEYDPQLVVVAEWRDPETLRKDHMDNAVTEVMLEGAERGDGLTYPWYLLPIARVMKAYSVVLNLLGKVGPVPEGMSATAGIRTTYYMKKHDAIYERLALKAQEFKMKNGYEPPYWEMVKMARAAMNEIEKK